MGRPKKDAETSIIERAKEKKTGVPKMPNPPPPPKKKEVEPEAKIESPKEPEIKALEPIIKLDEPKVDPPKEIQLDAIIAKYEQLCIQSSDINELLPIIREVASHCEHCTEFGVRNPTSTYAILAGNPKKLVSYDIVRHENVSQVEALAPNFEFVLGNSLEVDIEETDMLFIDTWHVYEQLKAELKRHSPKVKKFILMHDSISFHSRDEAPYNEQPQKVYGTGPGLMRAINEFLQEGNFKVDFHAEYNNGLMVLRRVK